MFSICPRQIFTTNFTAQKMENKIKNNFPKKTVYLRFLCDKYCDKIEDSLKNYDYYLLTLNKYDEFIEELTPEAEEMYKDSKIYNI